MKKIEDKELIIRKEFEAVFGKVEDEFIEAASPAIADAIYLTRSCCYAYGTNYDKDGYNTMHYCVASLIANHKYKIKDDSNIKREYYLSEEMDEIWNNTDRWTRAVKTFLEVLNHGISINCPRRDKGCIDDSPLMYAIEKHAPLDVIKLLMKYGAYIDQDLVSSTSVLSICYAYDYIEAAKLLLEAGADPNVLDDGICNPLAYVFDEYYEEKPDFAKMDKFINLFLEYGADPKWVDGFTDYCEVGDIYFVDSEPTPVLEHKKKAFKLLEKYIK